MRKVLASMLIFAAVGAGLGGGQALAAKPASQACLGESVSALASAAPGFGQFVSGEARADNGVGDAVQAIQAGFVPDSDLPNTCN